MEVLLNKICDSTVQTTAWICHILCRDETVWFDRSFILSGMTVFSFSRIKRSIEITEKNNVTKTQKTSYINIDVSNPVQI